jgi:NADPH-dependent 2,4-dienoyl-CoA reductase/sulfur reductase-like enzyme
MIGSFAIRSLRARRPDMSRGTATVHVMSTPAGSAAYSRWIYGLKGGLRLQAEKFIICTGGVSRRLPIPGFELTSTHSDAWRLTSIPPSMLVVGAGATGAQVASIFNAFGTRVQLFEAGTRILSTEDEDVATAAAESISVRGCGRTLIGPKPATR